jgi:hypothetical protein
VANGKSDQLKGRVTGIGAARVSIDDAQVALIEEYLRYPASGGGPDPRREAEAVGEDRPGSRQHQAAG